MSVPHPHPLLTTSVLELIRTLVIDGANINRMRAVLRRHEGVWFKDIDIIEAGRLVGFEIVPNQGASLSQPVVQLVTPKPGRPVDKVKLVAPGTWATKGGYRIGRKQ